MKQIQLNELPKKYQEEIHLMLDAEMNRRLHSEDGITIYEDEDFEFAEDIKKLGIEPDGGDFEIIVINTYK